MLSTRHGSKEANVATLLCYMLLYLPLVVKSFSSTSFLQNQQQLRTNCLVKLCTPAKEEDSTSESITEDLSNTERSPLLATVEQECFDPDPSSNTLDTKGDLNTNYEVKVQIEGILKIKNEPVVDDIAEATEEAINMTDFSMGTKGESDSMEQAVFERGLFIEENEGAVLSIAGKAEVLVSSDALEIIALMPTLSSNNTNTIEATSSSVSAASVAGEPDTQIIPTPNMKEILSFAIPATGIWLCSPLLSLIDTSAVGILSGTMQQAALNPAVSISDTASLLMAFLYTATTNMVASAQEVDREVKGRPLTTKKFISSMTLAGAVGLGLGTTLFVFAKFLVAAMLGKDGMSPGVVTAATKYVRIRALGMPAAAVIGSVQSACLGMKDIRSPLYVLVAAAVVNFVGDIIFVGSAHPWIGGTAGAAWATIFSQYAGVLFFVNWLCNKPKSKERPKVVNISSAIMEMTGKPSSEGKVRWQRLNDALNSPLQSVQQSYAGVDDCVMKPLGRFLQKLNLLTNRFRTKNESEVIKNEIKEPIFSARGLLEGHFRGRDLFKLPTKEVIHDFSPFFIPVTTTQVGRLSTWASMTHVISSSLGPVNMAAQQIILSIWFCISPVADALGLTAQSFVPGIFDRNPSRARADALRRMLRSFQKASVVLSVFICTAVALIPVVSKFFTSDPMVALTVNGVVPVFVFFASLYAAFCSAEGFLLGQKDLGFLKKVYSAFFFIFPVILLQVKKAALSGSRKVTLSHIWGVLLGYQIFRYLLWMARLMQLERKANREVETMLEDVITP